MIVVGDIEANGLFDDVTTIWCGVFKDVENDVVYEFTPHNLPEMYEFLDEVSTLIMHNGAQYDLPVMLKVAGYEFKGRLIDTLAISRMERPLRKAHSLGSWGETLRFHKGEHNEWDKYTKEMLFYCKRDVELTHKVAQNLDCLGEEPPLRHKVVTTLFQNLFLQEQNGWKIDVKHMEHSLSTLDRWMNRIRKVTESHLPILVVHGNEISKPFKRDGNLTKITGKYCEEVEMDRHTVSGPFGRVLFRTVSLDKPGELKTLLLNLGWQPEQYNHDKAGKQTSPKLSVTDQFEGIQGRLGHLVVKYTQCKHRRATILGWKEAQREDGTLPSKVTGLAVTSRARHSVIANIPRNTSFFGKWMRQHFIAREGWVLVGADAVGCQLRMLAARMNNEEFTHHVLHGDVHDYNKQLVGIEDRIDAKTLIYALIFGASNAKLSRMLRRDGAKVRRLLMQKLPALQRLLQEEEEKWKLTAKRGLTPWGKHDWRDGHVVGLDGRVIPVNSSHKILMGLLQSDEAILMQYAYNMYHNMLSHVGLVLGHDVATCCWYHDEIDSECKPFIADRIGQLKCDAIEKAGKFLRIVCPMEGEYKVGNNWAEIH